VAKAKAPYDAVIVPGVPFNGTAWDNTMKLRVHWAVHLFQQKITRNIIFSGGAVYSPYTEAKVMSLYAQQLGVPAANCFLDTLAEHSTENLYYGWRRARQLGFARIALATDVFQSKMTKSFARKMKRRIGAELDLIPVTWDPRKDSLQLSTPVIDPAPAFVPGFASIVDRQSFWYRFGGTLGKHVDWEEPAP
jgi:hypothetical protein